jgi:hypothetical protein
VEKGECTNGKMPDDEVIDDIDLPCSFYLPKHSGQRGPQRARFPEISMRI